MTTRGNGRAASALAVSAAVAAAAALTGGPPATAAPAPTAPQVRPIAPPVSKTLTLVTGQRIRVDMAGERVTAYRLLPGGGAAGALLSFGVGGGDRYTLPADAMPQIGRGLDLSLFDVTALARQTTQDGRIPVTLDFTGGATPTAPPGVQLTSTSPSTSRSTAAGYLTPAAFAQAVREHRLPPSLASVRLRGAPQAAAHPDFPLHTLQITAAGLAGAPADTPMGSIVLNTDDVSRFGTAVPVDGGEGNVQVPAGHYAIYTVFLDHDEQGSAVAYREVAQNATVADSDDTTAVTADESAADRRVSVTTPRPAKADLLKLTWFRKGPTGLVSFDSVQIGDPSTEAVYVNALPAAPDGSRYTVQWGGSSGPATGSGAYRYDVAFGSDDVPADQSFTVRDDQLATVEQHFSADPAGGDFPGALYALPVDDFTRAVEAAGQAVLAPPVDQGDTHIPGTRTEYMGTADGGAWAYTELTPQLDTFEADITTLTAGSTHRIDWAHGPLAPGLGAHRDQQLRDCTACAGGGLFSLYFPTGDSEPDHIGSTSATSANFTLYQNGTKVADEPDVLGAQVPATGQPATYRAVFDTDLAGTGATQSTRTHTELGFRDPGGTDPALALPADVPCPETDCRIMPALTLTYRLDTDQSNTSTGAEQAMDLTVGHLSYDGRGSQAAITSAAVSVSFDGGTTWQPAALTGAAGTYHATWQNTGTAAPALKVTASDAAGGTLTQTVTAAYSLAEGGLR
ncbi:molybdopterin-binding protein [Actinacidiphila bryophytorum]|uniref:hypothetical protein n=1 Tax=Actinacidiphila bryophytorum TaxID=1436133 RepID=UPI002176ADFA|nr:hypothetical protein [Actinacidiphila bryophytorum]UWE07750.1 hypothetical protein NYE86_02725 [Actinacidiphila bryophytorum]